MSELYLDNLTTKKKIERFIDIFIENSLNKNNWYINVWVREIINPTPFIEQILSQKTVPKLNIYYLRYLNTQIYLLQIPYVI